MSDGTEAPLWVWQAWTGPLADAAAGKALTDADSRAGLRLPMPPAPPMQWSATQAMWAVQTRPAAPIPTPAGCEEVTAKDMIGRMVGG